MRLRFFVSFVLGVALLPSCSKTSPVTESQPTSITAAQSAAVVKPAEPTKPKPTEEALAADASECRAPSAPRIVAIGDLHGDLKATKRAFSLAGATDDKGNWIGGSLVVVQTGDVVDRGDDERELLEFLDQQQAAAEKSGGHVYRLNGNHEIMNAQGDFRYVSERGFASFANERATSRPDATEYPANQRGRAEAFLPGGRMARKFGSFPVVFIVGDTVFAHGGVLPNHVRYGLDTMNREIGAWLRGEAALPKKLHGDHTPFWVRDYSENADSDACTKLGKVLTSLNVKRMVVGHTVQRGGITFACDRRVARIDVGLSAYYGNNPTEVLEIKGDEMRILHWDR